MRNHRRPHLTLLRVLLPAALIIALPLMAKEATPPRGEPSAGTVAPAALEDGIAVFFSPNGGALNALVDQINAARKTLDVQAYLLTTKEIVGPIAEAHKRGVKVRVVMDAKNAGDQYSAATYLFDNKVPVWTDAEHKEAHNKVMIIDRQILISGSFNFTKSADENNAENLLIMNGKTKLIAAFQKNFEAHLAHSKPYKK